MRGFTLLGVVLLGATVLAQQQPTFRSGIRLVQTNVLVHDKNGQPVGDLTAADFKIFEDGKEQKIEIFSVERSSNARGTPVERPSNDRQTVFTNRPVEARVTGGVTVILFDRLNTSFEDQTAARTEILKFLVKSQPNDRIALYALESDTVTVLHDFTSDSSRLIRVLNRYLGTVSPELAGSDTTVPDFIRTGDAAEDAKTEEFLKHLTQVISADYLKRRVEATSAALEAIANHLSGISGRKNLVWVSGGFPLIVDEGIFGPTVMIKEVRQATRAINNANVAVYPVDVRGLIGAFANPATASAPFSGRTPPQVFTTMATTHPSQDSMRTIAEDTGGHVYFNTNAIGDAVRSAMDDSKVSYVLGYYSTRPELDNRFRKIDVKVNRGGVDVRYRKGYLAMAPAEPKDAKARLAGLGRVMQSPLEASNIPLTAELKDDGVVIKLDAQSLTWNQKQNIREGAIDIVIAQSTPDGKYYKTKETTVSLSANPDQYKQMIEEGFTLSSSFARQRDAYRLHVVVADVPSQAVGSLIIPLK